jgi:hypothetical protein
MKTLRLRRHRMRSSSFAKHKAYESDILTTIGHKYVVDDWIWRGVPCVLLYKDGIMDVYPIQDYTEYELTMLQMDSSYKSAWIPIRYGSFIEMQECLYEIAREGLCAIGAKPLDMK